MNVKEKVLEAIRESRVQMQNKRTVLATLTGTRIPAANDRLNSARVELEAAEENKTHLALEAGRKAFEIEVEDEVQDRLADLLVGVELGDEVISDRTMTQRIAAIKVEARGFVEQQKVIDVEVVDGDGEVLDGEDNDIDEELF